MRSKIWLIALMVLGFGSALSAAVVTLNDGSSLSGEIKEQANGDLIVVTGAGEITVPKDKIRSVIKDGSTSAAAGNGGDMSYVNKVNARRERYGNEDGLPWSVNLQQNQLMLTLGQLNYTGDAFSSTSAALSGVSYGLAYARSFTDYAAMEYWGDYSYASKNYGSGASPINLKIQRYNVGVGPKIQKAMRLGQVESGMVLIPNIGISAVWSSANGGIDGIYSFDSSSFGGALGGGVDFQFGGALIALKVRYLMTTDVTNSPSLASSNTSAWIPQLGIGYSF